jgi:hypothetical protein
VHTSLEQAAAPQQAAATFLGLTVQSGTTKPPMQQSVLDEHHKPKSTKTFDPTKK